MFIVRGTNLVGFQSFACGTTEQSLEKVLELIWRGFQDISVTDPKGRRFTADEFQRAFNDDAFR